jgi:hypothetical protein
MALQTSGQISLSDIQNEYGGVNPISASEYYRGGSYVPNNVSTTTTVDSGWQYVGGNQLRRWQNYSGTGNYNFTRVYYYPFYKQINNSPNLTSYTSGNTTYYRGNVVNSNYHDPGYYVYYRRIKRVSQETTQEAVNQNVPTSGTVSLTNYYGGRKT